MIPREKDGNFLKSFPKIICLKDAYEAKRLRKSAAE